MYGTPETTSFFYDTIWYLFLNPFDTMITKRLSIQEMKQKQNKDAKTLKTTYYEAVKSLVTVNGTLESEENIDEQF